MKMVELPARFLITAGNGFELRDLLFDLLKFALRVRRRFIGFAV
jgi:hypothetical protein